MTIQAIYQNPVFLNPVIHKSVKIAPVTNYIFARNLNSVVVVGQEFLESSKYYPVVFSKSQSNDIIPLALLGLRNNENLFVTDDGRWKDGLYIPAFCRRYPFILVNNAGQDGSFSVAVDSRYEGFGRKDGMLLFNNKGETTPEFQNSIDFLKNYNTQYEKTKGLIKMLDEFNLLKDVAANITLKKGEKLGFKKLMMVDETVLLGLEKEKVMKLFRSGYLAWIYAHLYSLSNFKVLMNLASDKGNRKDVKKTRAGKPARKTSKKSVAK